MRHRHGGLQFYAGTRLGADRLALPAAFGGRGDVFRLSDLCGLRRLHIKKAGCREGLSDRDCGKGQRAHAKHDGGRSRKTGLQHHCSNPGLYRRGSGWFHPRLQESLFEFHRHLSRNWSRQAAPAPVGLHSSARLTRVTRLLVDSKDWLNSQVWRWPLSDNWTKADIDDASRLQAALLLPLLRRAYKQHQQKKFAAPLFGPANFFCIFTSSKQRPPPEKTCFIIYLKTRPSYE